MQRFCAKLRTWESCSVDSKHLRGELGGAGELEIVGGEGLLAAEMYMGNRNSGRVSRVHEVLFQGKREQGVDCRMNVGSK